MRVIFHVDMDAFFATIEEIETPALKDKPLIIGGQPDQRGVVASANYVARSFGVQAAMSTARALRRCPKAIVRPPQPELYKTYSRRLMAILQQFSPIIEPLSLDEAFLDMTGRVPDGISPEDEGLTLQSHIQAKTGLSSSIGIASNKLVAKIACASKKPQGLTYIPPGTEADFLAPLPIQDLWGTGPKIAKKLSEIGVKTIGDLTNLPEIKLVRLFGTNGAKMWRYAKGLDNRPVDTNRAIKSISQETTFNQDVDNPQILQETLQKMSEQIAQRLKKKDFSACRITLKLRYSDFTTITRSITRTPPINHSDDIYRQVLHLWEIHWKPTRPLRLIGVKVSRFIKGVQQLSLFDNL